MLHVESVAALAAAPADMPALERAWHRCLREAYAHQPTGQSRAGDTLNALEECKPYEDAYAAGLVAERPRSLWVRAWAVMTEPVAAWIGMFRH